MGWSLCVLWRFAVDCSGLQCDAVCCSYVEARGDFVETYWKILCGAMGCRAPCVVVWCCVLPCSAVGCSGLQWVAVGCSYMMVSQEVRDDDAVDMF